MYIHVTFFKIDPCVNILFSLLQWPTSQAPLSPMQAFMHIQQAYPVPDHTPMFSYIQNDKLILISQSQARLVLFNSLTALALNAKEYRFHTFRRSGASLAFNISVPVQYIKAPGTWASDAVWDYLHEISISHGTHHYYF